MISFDFKIAFVFLSLMSMCTIGSPSESKKGTIEDPIIDSEMTKEEIFDGLAPSCPDSIKNKQKAVAVLYYSFDNKVHRGQIVIDMDLADDVRYAFKRALEEKFPIHSVIPISHRDFRKEERWDDELSMKKNNSSAFNYREMTGQSKLSNHSYGWALDINPIQNPYIKEEKVLPPGSEYMKENPGTLTRNSAFTQALIERGWEWGGEWKTLKDYQHFEKKPKKD